MTNTEFLKANKLDFEVIKHQNTANGKLVSSYTTMINDTELGTVGQNYMVLQPSEQLEIMQKLANNLEYELEYGLPLKGNKQVMIALRVPDIKIADDTLKSYIVSINSYNSSTSLNFTFTDKTIRCSNIFRKHLNNSQFSIRHSASMYENIKDMITKINELNKVKEQHYSILERFVSTKYSKDLAIKQIDSLLNVEFVNESDYNENYSTRKKNIREKMIWSLEAEIADLNETMYACHNALSHYSTHFIDCNSDTAIKYTNTVFNNLAQLV